MEGAKRKEVALLLRAQVPFKIIMDQARVSRSTVSRVLRRLKTGNDLNSRSHGGHNKKLTSRVPSGLKKSLQKGSLHTGDKNGQI